MATLPCMATLPYMAGDLLARALHFARAAAAFGCLDAASFVLGDIGYVDADGWVYLKDRDSRIVISGGVNLYPAEVEAVLIVMPEVLDVAVIGVPDEEWGESLAALVELAADVDEQGARARIESHLAEQLAGYKHPKYWRFQALNRPDNGKLSLPALRRAFE